MRKYYLFIITNDYYKNYKTRPHVLFNTLSNLYTLKTRNLSYGVALYKSICSFFSKNILINYIERKYKHYHINKKIIRIKSKDEVTSVQINYSCVVILSSVNFPEILKTFYIYNKKIFVCDFYSGDYFFLSDQIKKLTI